MLVSEQDGKVDVFEVFSRGAAHPFPYPEDNMTIFEEWFSENFGPQDIRTRIYLPIFWTGYYVRADYGKSKLLVDHLQGYLNILDKSKKYYTIVQYDDGILNDLSGLDIRVYSMSGKPMDYPLPLICQPHMFRFPGLRRDLRCSFVGRVTHPVRQELINTFRSREGFYFTEKHHSLEEYCRVMARSVFALCPRGYGPTSFRICEALQYGAIPIYISDEVFFGHHIRFPGGSLAITHELEHDIEVAMGIMETDIDRFQVATVDCYQHYYTYAATKQLILEDLSKEIF